MERTSNLPYVNVPETIGTPPDKEQVEKATRSLAYYIFSHTSYRLLNTKTGETFTESENLPVVPEIKIQSLLNDWKYWNGVIHLAFYEMAKTFNDNKYIDYAKNNYNFIFKHLPYFKKQFDARVPGASLHQYYRLDRLDDFGAMAAGLFEVYKTDPKPEYKAYLESIIDYIANKQDRLEDGTFCRNRFGFTSLWGDDLYMSVPFLIKTWQYTNDNKHLEDAIKQVINFRKHLYRPENGIYYHYRIMQEEHPGVAHWGRVNGWMIVAQCELLQALPKDHPKRNELIAILKEHIIGLARFQTANGMWRQLLDKSDSFLEASATAMYTYAVAKAVNEGWISDIYSSIAVNGWNALVKYCIKDGGYFDNVSTGFNFKQDLSFYYNIAIEPGGDHGIGAAVLAGVEVFKMKEYRDCVWC
jgi:unsaturated rhamnogalacturonyl hydrolase